MVKDPDTPAFARGVTFPFLSGFFEVNTPPSQEKREHHV